MKKDIHISCSTLSKFAFDEIILTNDFRWLVKGYNGEGGFDIEDTKPFEKIFEKILKQYLSLSADKTEIKNLKTQLLISQMEFKYKATIEILNLYSKFQEIEVLLLLKDLNWDLDTSKSLGPQIDRISKLLIGLKMKIKIQKANYSKKQKTKEDILSEKISLDKEALYLESNLDLGYNINPRKTSCERWINLKKLAKEKADYYENQKINKNG